MTSRVGERNRRIQCPSNQLKEVFQEGGSDQLSCIANELNDNKIGSRIMNWAKKGPLVTQCFKK